MRRCRYLVLMMAAVGWPLLAHDFWLEVASPRLEIGRPVVLRAGNGILLKESENAVAPERISEAALLDPQGRRIPLTDLYVEDTWLKADWIPQEEGDYWLGMAIRPRSLELAAADFNEYLSHDGLPHVLEKRRRDGTLQQDVWEEYAKYAKTYVRVGGKGSRNYQTPLGLKIEIIPLQHPLDLSPPAELEVEVRFEGKPLPQFYLQWGRQRELETLESAFTDERGRAQVRLSGPGLWVLRGIHMEELERGSRYRSHWASLTFLLPAGN